MTWNEEAVLVNRYRWPAKITQQQSHLSPKIPISTKFQTVAATSTVEHDWTVVIDVSSCAIQLIRITKSTTAESVVRENASLVIHVNAFAIKSAVNVQK
jgi:hypothetical protein